MCNYLIGQGVSGADVNEVAQEVFLRLLRYDKGELIDYPQAYLSKMAANVVNEWAIRASRRVGHPCRGRSAKAACDLSHWWPDYIDCVDPVCIAGDLWSCP